MASRKHVFTQIEKKVFLEVLKSHATIIENKNTDGSTLRQKNEAWDNITREYNASPHVTAEVSNKQLRRLWMNLKQRQREALTKERQQRMATGGGPSTSSAVIDPDVAQIVPSLLVEIPGAIDSDVVILDSADVSFPMDISQPEINQNITEPLLPDPNTTSTPPIVTNPPPLTIVTPPPCIFTPPPCTITPPPPGTPTPPPRNATPPYPSTATSPPLPTRTLPPPRSTSTTSTTSYQRHKNSILDREYMDRCNRAKEIHEMQKELLSFQIREAKAKAELAELLLQEQHSKGDNNK